MEEASSSPMSQNPPTRGVSLRSDKAFDTQAAMEEAIGEVREAMTQYTLFADPTESAASLQRLGPQTLITVAAAPYVLQRLGGPQTMNPDATAPSVLQRLGPQIMIPDKAGPSAGTPTANRKYGRPPWKKVVSESSNKRVVSATNRRRTSVAKPPISRRKLATAFSQVN
ncbi:hypothetical protein F2Q69_00014468 [Brassica cretica]|uniref:Uncharacterized protein n=1 Tax=Brassica cretica TaxID=69181 RepID=A0A8S9R285_BRACR|nr:hypothetical protein F2Q69_00014468 [Brassica cretica]